MRQSELYTKTSKNTPTDEAARNAKLLTRGGYIHKEMAGVYSLLPLGLRVIEKIEQIIREEVNSIGGQEVQMASLQDPKLWQKSGRWDDKVVDNWFKSQDAEFGFANTHEEPLANQLRQHIHSYKDLPLYIYQFQTKFRREVRPKSGLLRTREFLMKDLYSFTRTVSELDEFYELCARAYLTIFRRVGIGHATYRTFASGGSFSKYSDEFQTVCSTGEDTIYLNRKERVAVNKEVYTPAVLKDLHLNRKDLIEEKAIEVGNIFKLGTRFSEAVGLVYRDETGVDQPVIMGSYGIGLGRLMGTVAEVLADKDGLVWPETIAPYKIHLVELGEDLGLKVYQDLIKAGGEVLYDDRELSAGEKLKDADLLGMPWRVLVSEKTGKKVELKARTASKSELLTSNEAIRKLI